MELRQLEYFQTVSRLRNITRAAERLGVTQPNITVAIKKLEAELGLQLFDRSQKQLVPTPEGAVFLKHVEPALRGIRHAISVVNEYKELQKGSLKIGIPPMMGAYLFPRIFHGFQCQHPHLAILLSESGSMDIRLQLEQEELDFGIIIISDAAPTLQLLPMMTSQVVACVPESHPLAGRASLRATDLEGQDVILLKEGSYLREIAQQTFRDFHVSPSIVLESSQIVTIQGLVANGVGIAFLLDFIAEAAPGIRPVPLSPPMSIDIGLAWKKARPVSQAAQAFIGFCRETLASK